MMKRLFAILLCLTQPAWGAFTLIAHVGCGNGGAGCTTAAIDTTAGGGADLIVVHVGYLIGTVDSISDSVNGSGYTALTAHNSRSRMWYFFNSGTSANHTFTVAATDSFPSMEVLAFKGSQLSPDPFFAENGANGTSPPYTANTGAVTVNATGDLVVTGIMNGSIENILTSGYTISDQVTFVVATNYRSAASYKLSGTGSESDTWGNIGDFSSWGASIATFKQASAGAATPVCPSPFCGIIQ